MPLTLSLALLALSASLPTAAAPPQGSDPPLPTRTHELAVRPGEGLGPIELGMARAELEERPGVRPGFTTAVLEYRSVQVAFQGAPPAAATAWVELADAEHPTNNPHVTPTYQGRSIRLDQPPPGIALTFGACEPVEHLTGGNRVQCQGGHVSVEWNLCPAGLAGPCRTLKIRVSRPTRTAVKPPTCDAYVYGDLLLTAKHVQHLSLRPKLAPGQAVCLGALPIREGTPRQQVQTLLGPRCALTESASGAWLRCPGLGVALGFPGSMGGLEVLALDSDGRTSPAHAFGEPSTLALYEVVTPTTPGSKVLWDATGHPVVVAGTAALTSADVASLSLSRTGPSPQPAIAVTFKPDAAKRLEALTRRLVRRKLAIAVDGCVYSAPRVMEAITGGKALITLPTGEDPQALRDALRKGLPKPTGSQPATE